jgi:hypothetical protein
MLFGTSMNVSAIKGVVGASVADALAQQKLQRIDRRAIPALHSDR